MTQTQYLKNLIVPQDKIDVVLDTDAYNEIDDQFAIGYMLRKERELNVKGICAAQFMATLADAYSPEAPLYIVAIGAITNVASALLKNPRMKENCVVIWLGGHAAHIPLAASEFNMYQDIAAARVVLSSGVPLVLLPCGGVVDHFTTSKYELEHWLRGKNALCDYLCDNTIAEAESYASGKPWTRVVWDVTAVAWLLNRDGRFMKDCLIPAPIPEYDLHYARDDTRHLVRSVYELNRDALFEDLFATLSE